MNIELMNAAIQLAIENEGTQRAKMAAVLVKGNTVLSTGTNQYKTHPLQAKFSKNDDAVFMHAEINCLVKYIREYGLSGLDKCDMYVARVFRDGTPALAKPCTGCKRAIMEFGIRNVYWSDYEKID